MRTHGRGPPYTMVDIHDVHATLPHLLGLDDTNLTFHHNEANRRLRDVHGKVIKAVLG